MPIYFRSHPVSEPFTFDSIGNHWAQEPTSRTHGYPHYHYLQTEKGCGNIIIQGKKYILNEGEGVLTAPCVRHSYYAQGPDWITLFATFTGTLESSLDMILGKRQGVFTEKDQGARIAALISDSVEKFKQTPADAESLSVDCYRLLMNFVDGVSTRELLNDPLYQRYVEPVIKVIETDYSLELTAQHLCGLVYITPQYLSRLFVRFLGCSVYEYLTVYRMNKSKEFLLTYPQMEVQEIAHRVGFPDSSHFIAMFKKRMGMTPLEFRKLS